MTGRAAHAFLFVTVEGSPTSRHPTSDSHVFVLVLHLLPGNPLAAVVLGPSEAKPSPAAAAAAACTMGRRLVNEA